MSTMYARGLVSREARSERTMGIGNAKPFAAEWARRYYPGTRILNIHKTLLCECTRLASVHPEKNPAADKSHQARRIYTQKSHFETLKTK